ncbi:hypothetical protein HQ545_07640 [Candidatus Woesearchaeota archaeon]|nr:hypothetical protein [Candidatus Woesearchaeota archaeon]
MKKRFAVLILVFLFAFAVFTQASVTVEKTEIILDDVLIGNPARDTVLLTSDDDVPIRVSIVVSPSLREIIIVKPDQGLFVGKSAPLLLEIIATPQSEEIVEGSIDVFLQVVNNDAISSLSDTYFAIPVKLSGSTSESRSLEVESVTLHNGESGGDIDIELHVINDGNREEHLSVSIDDGSRSFEFAESIPAFYDDHMHFPVQLEGTGIANIIVTSGTDIVHEDKVMYALGEKGSLIKKLRIVHVETFTKDNRTYLTTVIENQGDVAMMARVVHDALLEDNSVGKAEVDVFVPAGDVARAVTRLKVPGSGYYDLSTVAYYGDTFTDARIDRFAVSEDGGEIPLSAGLFVAILGLFALFMIIFYRKRKK